MKLVLVLIVMCCQMGVHACSCVGIESFCLLISRYLPADEDDRMIIVRARIVEKVPSKYAPQLTNDLIVEVLESFYNPRSIEKIRILEGNGADCGRSLESYDVGDQLIFAEWILMDTVTTAHFSICSPEPLRVQGNSVEGKILRADDHSMSLVKFRSLPFCTQQAFNFYVYPNPAQLTVNIHLPIKHESSRGQSIVIHDVIGRLVFEKALDEVGTTESVMSIDVSQWPAGIYLLSVPEVSGMKTKQVVIAR